MPFARVRRAQLGDWPILDEPRWLFPGVYEVILDRSSYGPQEVGERRSSRESSCASDEPMGVGRSLSHPYMIPSQGSLVSASLIPRHFHPLIMHLCAW